jgi:Arc/MetJ family transcription regulator
MATRWAEYDRWNEALTGLIYSGDSAFEPVYLDLDDEFLQRAAERLGLDGDPARVQETLAQAVRQTLLLGLSNSGVSALAAHTSRLRRWRAMRRESSAGSASPPPVVALLAAFTRAAELMGRDEQYTGRAYFPRLYQLLNIEPADEGRIASAFRNETEAYWRALNDWLESHDGALGEPTAEALGYRYIGLPMSQALIRKADRQSLTGMFFDEDLEPGLRLTPDDMAALLKPWLTSGGGTTSLRSIWKSATARKLLIESAIQALVQWPGDPPPRPPGEPLLVRPPRLTARLARSGLGKARLDISFVLRGVVSGPRSLGQTWEVRSSPDDPSPLIDLVQLTDKFAAPALAGQVDGASLVSGQFRLRSASADVAPAVTVSRRPQPIVVLSRLEEAALYVEVDHAHLGETHLVLVNEAATKPNGQPRFALDSLLQQIAQPGFTRLAEVAGLPAGWSLYRDVVIMARHTLTDLALDVLRPDQTSVLTVSGGLRMPGHAQRWSAFVPLTIRGIAHDHEDVTLTLTHLDDSGEYVPAHVWQASAAEVVGTTDGLHLAHGRYRVELGSSRESTPLASVSFQLCSSADPRVRTSEDRLRYWLEPVPRASRQSAQMPGELAASHAGVPTPDNGAGSAGTWVTGAVAEGGAPAGEPAERVPGPPWWKMEPATDPTFVLAEPAPPDSCAITGMHREVIETHVSGKRDRGVCQGCGRVRMYSANPRSKRKTGEDAQAPALPHLQALGDVAERSPVGGADLLDALVWLGAGSGPQLAQMVRQADDSALSVHEVTGALESLGHLDIARTAGDPSPGAWSVSARCLAETHDGGWLLVGNWDVASTAALAELVTEAGGSYRVAEDQWIPRRSVYGLLSDQVATLAQAAGSTLAAASGQRILDLLRPVREVAAALPRTSAEGIYNAEWFNVAAASWTRVETINQPGAYRVRTGFVTRYLFRDSADVDRQEAARVSAPFAKHAAASSRPLLAYDQTSRTVLVPIGAELPGLYGRAIALFSGQPPARVQGSALLAYEDVPPEAAAQLLDLLKG